MLKLIWAFPNTLLGVLAVLASVSIPRRREGFLYAQSSRGFARWFLSRRGYCAITLGHLILLTDSAPETVIPHELAHVRQSERWGPLFLPAYLAAMLVVRVRGRNPYWDNPFEIEARQFDPH